MEDVLEKSLRYVGYDVKRGHEYYGLVDIRLPMKILGKIKC